MVLEIDLPATPIRERERATLIRENNDEWLKVESIVYSDIPIVRDFTCLLAQVGYNNTKIKTNEKSILYLYNWEFSSEFNFFCTNNNQFSWPCASVPWN